MIQQGPLDIVAPGDAVTAELHNQSKLAIMRMNGAGPSRQVIGHPIPKGGTGAGVIERFRIMKDDPDTALPIPTVRDDFFYAMRFSTDEVTKVAKPNELRTTPWDTGHRADAGLNREVHLDVFDVMVEYVYPNIRFDPLNFDKRWSTREDEPNIREIQVIWPAYWHEIHADTPIGIIYAAQVGEEATGIEGVEWQDMNDSGRVWTVFPAAFRAET